MIQLPHSQALSTDHGPRPAAIHADPAAGSQWKPAGALTNSAKKMWIFQSVDDWGFNHQKWGFNHQNQSKWGFNHQKC